MSSDNAEKQEQIERGKRIKYIRENELQLNKSQLAELIGISSQFLGLVEDGKGNLVYRSLKKLKDVSGHSSDYILYGLDDSIVEETNKILEKYTEKELMAAFRILKNISIFIKNKRTIRYGDKFELLLICKSLNLSPLSHFIPIGSKSFLLSLYYL